MALRQPAVTPPSLHHSFVARLYAATAKMGADDLKHFLADAPPSVVRLEIEKHFEALSDKQKRYAHFISR